MNSPPPAALVCLDLQRARVSGAPAAAAQVTGACRRVLEQARARAWPVLHVHRREATAEGARPIVGLEPLPTEPIYLRRGPSAFSHPAFARRAQGLGGPLALIGFSMTDAVLATALPPPTCNCRSRCSATPSRPASAMIRTCAAPSARR